MEKNINNFYIGILFAFVAVFCCTNHSAHAHKFEDGVWGQMSDSDKSDTLHKWRHMRDALSPYYDASPDKTTVLNETIKLSAHDIARDLQYTSMPRDLYLYKRFKHSIFSQGWMTAEMIRYTSHIASLERATKRDKGVPVPMRIVKWPDSTKTITVGLITDPHTQKSTADSWKKTYQEFIKIEKDIEEATGIDLVFIKEPKKDYDGDLYSIADITIHLELLDARREGAMRRDFGVKESLIDFYPSYISFKNKEERQEYNRNILYGAPGPSTDDHPLDFWNKNPAYKKDEHYLFNSYEQKFRIESRRGRHPPFGKSKRKPRFSVSGTKIIDSNYSIVRSICNDHRKFFGLGDAHGEFLRKCIVSSLGVDDPENLLSGFQNELLLLKILYSTKVKRGQTKKNLEKVVEGVLFPLKQ